MYVLCFTRPRYQVSVYRTIGPLVLKLGMYWGLKFYKVYINDDPGLTLTYFMARSNWVTCTFEWGKSDSKSFNGEKTCSKGQY